MVSPQQCGNLPHETQLAASDPGAPRDTARVLSPDARSGGLPQPRGLPAAAKEPRQALHRKDAKEPCRWLTAEAGDRATAMVAARLAAAAGTRPLSRAMKGSCGLSS